MDGAPVRLEEHPLPRARRGRQGGQHRAARLRAAARPRRGQLDTEYVELPGGHISLIAGRGAFRACWPKVASWLEAEIIGGESNGGPRRAPSTLRPLEESRWRRGLEPAQDGRAGTVAGPQAFWRPFMDQGMQACPR